MERVELSCLCEASILKTDVYTSSTTSALAESDGLEPPRPYGLHSFQDYLALLCDFPFLTSGGDEIRTHTPLRTDTLAVCCATITPLLHVGQFYLPLL